MAQIRPEYEVIEEFKDIATKLVEKYPDVLDGVSPDLICCLGITNKDPKEGKPLWTLMPCVMPFRLHNPYAFYAVVNMQDWNSFDDSHKALLAFDVLCSVSREGDEKVVPFDLKGHSVIYRTVGVDYMQRPDVPNILTEDIQWKKEAHQ